MTFEDEIVFKVLRAALMESRNREACSSEIHATYYSGIVITRRDRIRITAEFDVVLKM
jgi:hypothetical protein